ncbi:MAG TPA: PxKF domain-containing protein [Polyangia bacterium]|nr:PxKF domain-containing protein [Polyangia bacterium]
MLKLDTAGTVVWAKTWGGPSYDSAYDLAFDSVGNLIVVGESYDCSEGCSNSALIMKMSPDGALIWSGAYETEKSAFAATDFTVYTAAYAVTVDTGGDIVVAGTSWTFSPLLGTSLLLNRNSILVFKLDPDGATIWASDWIVADGSSESINFHAVTTDADRNIYVGGRQCSDAFVCEFDPLVLKLEPALGSLRWARTISGAGWDSAGSVAWDPGGQLVVSGVRDGSGVPDLLLSRYDASGALLDHRRTSLGPLPTSAGVNEVGMVLGPEGQPIVVGRAGPAGGQTWVKQSVTPVDVPETTSSHVERDHLIFASPNLEAQDLAVPTAIPSGAVVDSAAGGPDVFLSVDATPSVIGKLSLSGAPVDPSRVSFQVDGLPVSASTASDGSYEIFGIVPGLHQVLVYQASGPNCGLEFMGAVSVTTIAGSPAVANIDLTPFTGKLVGQLTVNGAWFIPGEEVTLSVNGLMNLGASVLGCPIVKSEASGRVETYLTGGTYSAVVTTSRGNRLGYLNFVITAGQVTDLGTVDFTPEQVDIALNPTCTGFPSPAESDHGWGGGSNACEIVDGKLWYETSAHGLAFTGGHQTAAGGPPYVEPAGVRHAVIDFGAPKTFRAVTIWWHGVEHTPDVGTLEVWNGSSWVAIPGVQRQYGSVHVDGLDSGYSDSDMYTFPPVTGSKVRYRFDNNGNNILGTLNIHGWIYEMEVWAQLGDAPLDGGTTEDGGTGFDGGIDPNVCAHDICVPGSAVSRTCSQGFFCAARICLTDPGCCSIAWDATCVAAVDSVCHVACDGDGGVPSGAPIGAPCTAIGDCVPGAYCTDGVCCNSACGDSHDDDCQVCSAAKGATANGQCTLLSSTHMCRVSSGDQCDLGGFCAGGPNCPANTSASSTTCYTRPADDQCASKEAEIHCGTNLTCPAPSQWPSGSCEAPDASDLVTLYDDAGGTVTVQLTYPWDGTISVTRATGCPPATGFTFPPATDPTVDPASIYWDLNAVPPLDCTNGDVQVCITYPQSWFGGTDPAEVSSLESYLQLRHGTSAAQISPTTCDPDLAGWSYLPQTVDATTNVVCANTCTLSPFAFMVPSSVAQIPTVHPPAAIVAEATSAAGAIVNFTTSASDLEDGPLSPTCLPASGSTFPLGATTVTCHATDSDHLTGTATFTVTVADTKGPVFTNVPASPVVAYATCTAGAKVTYKVPTATDAVDGAVPVHCAPASGSTFALGKTTVICNAADGGGRAAPPAMFTIWVQVQAPADGTFFLAPINPDGSSIFNGGTIPVKFKLTGASASIANLTARLLVTKVSSGISGSVLEATSTSTADIGNVFRYDPTARQYIFNLSTKSLAAGTWSLRADLGDAVYHQINVSLKGK